jgi:hypothetical protein
VNAATNMRVENLTPGEPRCLIFFDLYGCAVIDFTKVEENIEKDETVYQSSFRRNLATMNRKFLIGKG